jgi:uncharacterized protein (DUF1778 family)
MSRALVKRESRIELRVTSEQKRLVESAARSQGRSLSDFAVAELSRAAEHALREREELSILTLGARDREFFCETMLNPPKANAKLRAAFKHHGKVTAQSSDLPEPRR